VDAAAVARQIGRVAQDPGLYRSLVQGVVRHQRNWGTRTFLDNVLNAIPAVSIEGALPNHLVV